MRIIRWVKYALAPAALLLVGAGMQAQATRTWVSGVGDDVNPCSRTAPCKTFAGAISKTASGGIIDALDPGGYGAVTITKPITIEGNGTLASALGSGVSGIVINITTGLNRHVVLRNLLVDGSGTTLGVNGVRFLAGDSLLVENCSLEQFSNVGIEFAPAGVATLTVRNSTIAQATVGGILVKPGVAGTARAEIVDSLLTKNGYGVRVEDNSNVLVINSRSVANTGNGLWVFSNGLSCALFSDSNLVAHNGSAGLQTNGGNAAMRVTNTTVVNNLGTGVNAVSGELSSYIDNKVLNNGAPGAFTAPVQTKN